MVSIKILVDVLLPDEFKSLFLALVTIVLLKNTIEAHNSLAY